MNNSLSLPDITSIPSMSEAEVSYAKDIEKEMLKAPQTAITTNHILHAGVYTRTILLPKGCAIVGALIKRSVNLIISGHADVYIGTEWRVYEGFVATTAKANRKQMYYAKEDTYISMFFATSAKTVEEAEAEFTDEADLLVSRKKGNINNIIITGE